MEWNLPGGPRHPDVDKRDLHDEQLAPQAGPSALRYDWLAETGKRNV